MACFPRVSVLLPAYNAEPYIRQSVQSVLGQSFEDFELLVIDDCSTDQTGAILASMQDRRLRVLRNSRNSGIVASLNRGMAEARGAYIARIDADDLCLPTRFAKQTAYLDDHPDAIMVGAEMSVLDNGRIRRSRQPADPNPMVLRWQFHISNPVGHPSMMFRRSAVEAFGFYLRDRFQYAEDFDFSHRLLQIGRIAVLPEFLVIYRRHSATISVTRREETAVKTAAVLRDVYTELLGADAAEEARLAAEYFVARAEVRSLAVLDQLGRLLDRLVDAFLARHGLAGDCAAGVIAHAARLWWTIVQTSLRTGMVIPAALGHRHFRRNAAGRPALHRIARSAASGLVRSRLRLSNTKPAPPSPSAAIARGIVLKDVRFEAEPIRTDDPPSLYVVVDTEAEFDWSKPFDRGETRVSAIASQWRAQTIFDVYGLRPIYVVDYAVASQPEGYMPLRGFLDRHACAIGAHLHPWITPPFEEVVSDHHSFAGNLPASLEERKLRALVEMIRQNFQVAPLFFKAGRYGIGPHTMQALARLGIAVDFSIMPMTDMTWKGGVDFRMAEAWPYREAAHGILSVPMSRGQIGVMRPFSPGQVAGLQSRPMTRLHIPGILSRLGLANIVTLTPEGATAAEQIQLVRAMARRGHRVFVMHYHSPSLAAGHTQYVRSEAELADFVRRIEALCRFFFVELGGMPGNPADLLPPQQREQIWPSPPNPV